MKNSTKADISLFFVAVLWGLSFLIVKGALESIDVFNMLSIRFIIAGVLAVVIFNKNFRKIDIKTIKTGSLLGSFLFIGFILQTFGLLYTDPSKSAFITGFSVVLVPIIAATISRFKPSPSEVLAAIIALFGIGLLSLNGGSSSFNIGDFLTLLSAFAFAFHIVFVGKFSNKVDTLNSGIVQILFVGLLSTIISISIGTFSIPKEPSLLKAIIFLSIFCTLYSFVAQSVAQKFTTPSRVSLLFTLEPVSAAFFGWLFYKEVLSLAGFIGAMLIVSGMIISELNLIDKGKKKFIEKISA